MHLVMSMRKIVLNWGGCEDNRVMIKNRNKIMYFCIRVKKFGKGKKC